MTLLRATRYAGQAPLHRVRLEDLSSVAPQERRRVVATGIPLRDLHLAWPELWPLLERAARRAKPKPVEMADTLATIIDGHAQLWAVYDGDKPIAAITTQVTLDAEPRCRVWLVGGSRMGEWLPGFLAKLSPWARSVGCTMIWGTQSRSAWVRIARKLGCESIEPFNGIPAWGWRI